MARPAWSGFLRLSLVSVPVQAYAADKPNDGKAQFNQLHKKCHSRIKYKKVCPVHGEVAADEIVSAYQYESGRYVILDDDEIKELKSSGAAKNRGIGIQSFIPAGSVDPLLFEGRNYYLLPDGAAGEEPYALLQRALDDEQRWGVAQAVLWGRKRVVLIRPAEKLLTMSLMQYASQLKDAEEFAGKAPEVKLRADELKLAKRLIAETSEESVDWSEFTDDYAEELKAVVKAKAAGDEVVAPEPEEEVPVLSLIDALKRSVHRPKLRNETAARAKRSSSSQRSGKSSAERGARKRKSAG
jgi:DNA end-binding protein Ku